MSDAPFTIEIITLVPKIWPMLLSAESGLVGKAFEQGLVSLHLRNLRSYGSGNHQQVDDAPFGGGAGMVLKIKPLHGAICDARIQTKGPVILLTPRGNPLKQIHIQELAKGPGMILVCGRYEGIDERVRRYVDLEFSVGDYVLSAGDPAAWCLIDAVVRCRPGVLGNAISTQDESFSHGLLEYPQYTRPVEYDGVEVPKVLRSGDHAAIETWRKEQAQQITRVFRPDLLEKSTLAP